MSAGLPEEADAVFEGGGVKSIAFAGALSAAEEAGIRRWVNVAGTSAGAITAALVAAGYDARGLERILDQAEYHRFADHGPGGRWLGGLRHALRGRGVAAGDYFVEWLGDRLEQSPLADRDVTFAALEREDLPADLSAEDRARARFRLRVIASDISAGRMLVLPDDIVLYRGPDGEPLDPTGLKVTDAVRMSMSFPFFFEPVCLHDEDRRPHFIVDGGVLSSFPIWLFDRGQGPLGRPTWGFRLHRGEGEHEPPYREIERPFWPLPMAKALFFSATEAWDQRMSEPSKRRTMSIPTGDAKTLDFNLSASQRERLYESGERAGERFFRDAGRRLLRDRADYLNSFGRSLPVSRANGGRLS